jgi:hypothetical protein
MMINSYNLEPLMFPLPADSAEKALENHSYCPFTTLEEPNSPMNLSQYLLLTGGSHNEVSGMKSTSREMSDGCWYDGQYEGIERNLEEPVGMIDAERLEIGGYRF